MKQLLSMAMLVFIPAPAAWAGCTSPAPPAALPNGKSATREDMMAAEKEIDRYELEMEACLSCEKNDSKQQVAQTQLERVASKFNSEVRACKAANAGG
jgi:hypothetical protein